jgi:hypothetical protein
VSLGMQLPTPGAAVDETDQLRQWWRRLTDGARAAFLADPDGPIPPDYLDEAMAGGIRVLGVQRGRAGMQWSWPPETRVFIKRQTGSS